MKKPRLSNWPSYIYIYQVNFRAGLVKPGLNPEPISLTTSFLLTQASMSNTIDMLGLILTSVAETAAYSVPIPLFFLTEHFIIGGGNRPRFKHTHTRTDLNTHISQSLSEMTMGRCFWLRVLNVAQ